MYLVFILLITLLIFFRFVLYINVLKKDNALLESFSQLLKQLKDKSHVVCINNMERACKRCGLGKIKENKRYRFRVNDSKMWVNELQSYFYCSRCTFKSLDLKKLVKHIGDKSNNGI